MPQEYIQERRMSLTPADLTALSEMLEKQHACRFDNISREDMDFIKDLLAVYKETRSEFIKWVVRGIIYGSLILILIAGYFKFSGKH